ncbi:MAG: ABC transporter permease, partial [Chloroflexi bacterium]
MVRYATRRILALIPTLFGVSLVVFLMIHLIPGDPASAFLRENASAEDVARVTERLGLNKPLPQQYVDWLGRILRLDLGESLHTSLPVAGQLAAKLPATAELAITAMVIATVVGLVLGVVAGMRRNTALDFGPMALGLVGVSMPIFWLGLMAIYLFAVNLRVLPPSTRGPEPDQVRTGFYTIDYLLMGDVSGFVNAVSFLLMPSFVLATVPLAVIARQTRSAMLEVLHQDYVRTAWAKGLRERRVVLRHVMKNALLPVITVVGLQVGLLLSGAFLTETVFSWPGLATYVVAAINGRDYPVVQGTVLIFA